MDQPRDKWLERIGKQLEQGVVDRETLDSGQSKAMDGYQRLNRIFNGQLDDILRDIADAMWQTATLMAKGAVWDMVHARRR